VPSALYFINNNLGIHIQLYMDSTSYQVLSNLKILTTATLYHLIMKKRLNRVKLVSLVILLFAGVLYSVGNLNNSASQAHRQIIPVSNGSELVIDQADLLQTNQSKRDIYITGIGFLLILVYCSISGLAGVCNEFLMKLNFKDSIYMQNIYMYTYGVLFNMIATVSLFTASLERNETIKARSSGNLEQLTDFFFTGFNVYTWLLIATQVFNGLSMSIVMKHSSNITRLFIISSSMIVATFLSVTAFSLQLNAYFYACFLAVLVAHYLYTI
jgi:probable UDP-sugar transporter A4